MRLCLDLPEEFNESNNANRLLVQIGLLVLAPFVLLALKFRLAFLNLKMNMNLDNQELVKKWENTKRMINNHIKLELGLETIYQVTGQLILLALALTDTRTTEGFSSIFSIHASTPPNGNYTFWQYPITSFHESTNIDQSTMTIILLVLSILKSFVGCITSHLKALTACRERFPLNSKLSATFFCFFSTTTRVLAMTMYFAVPLGLFSLMKHLQHEQIPWNPTFVSNFVWPYPNGTIIFGNSDPVEWTLLDRWKRNISVLPFVYRADFYSAKEIEDFGYATWNPKHLISPPDYMLYTYFNLFQYFLLFLVQMAFCLHC